ncbi:response regulator [Paenibacillus albidus]|uniref:response regulator n=1 Tax=Paenibacillus albidus TaxID=2041023 RepID=UPI001BE7A1E0|nr:response regulator [Paenibacillus albidus]MBT2288900.1 response regulator [Paenibacillus albidus]
MYRALIAEDSKPILRNIQALVHASELPVEIVASASNGMEALEYIRNNPVDILLTDIRMPKLDGLALIEQAKNLNPQLKAVLISGYSDFEYTRKALNLQVFDYLLKPVERPQLVEVMERLVQQLNERHSTDKDLFKEIVDPGFHASMKLDADFSLHPKRVFVVRKQPFTPDLPGHHAAVIRDCFTQAYAPHTCWVFPAQAADQLLVLVNASIQEKYPDIQECMEAAQQRLQVEGLEVSMATQVQAVENQAVPELYDRISRMLIEQMSLGRCLLLDAGSALTTGMRVNTELEQLTACFVDMINQRQKEKCEHRLRQQLAGWHSGTIRMAELEKFTWTLADAFARIAYHQEPEGRLKLAAEVRALFVQDSYAAFCEALLTWTGQCFELMYNLNKKSSYELFRQLDQYLQLNLYSQVSIGDLALKFHVSPSYISRIIKKYTQNTFVHYYMRLKINEACRLIADKPDIKVKELAEVLSFGDQHYFSRVFKEYTGSSPTEYKDQAK